jgi:hypothetical protein
MFSIVTPACCSLSGSTSGLYSFNQEHSLLRQEAGKSDTILGSEKAREPGMPYCKRKRKRKRRASHNE